jgi:7,8-dihydropterin-6-yl-methyl-4-(beta-D-ribofuranosyl)aminobenzene 5'-phosphate synthase
MTCSAIRSWNPEIVIPCHCTGDTAEASLVETLGSRVIPGYAGLLFSASRFPDAVKTGLRFAALPPGAAERRS